ncbi:MAG TPA: hypothetical protein VG936_17585 [Lacunisphaera sp.]|nr:hypothetical protein [Lacunisphaera sp.]
MSATLQPLPSPPFSRRPRFVAVLGIATWLALAVAAGGVLEVKVDSVFLPALAAHRGFSYRVRHFAELHDLQSLHYQEALGFVCTALSGLGMFEAPPGVRPDFLVDFNYGMTPFALHRTIEILPVARQTGGGDPWGAAGMTAFIPVERTRVTCTKYLIVIGREYADVDRASDSSPRALWRVEASIEDETRMLRSYLPVLAAAVMGHIGTDSHGPTKIRLSTSDAEIAFIRATGVRTPRSTPGKQLAAR